MKLKSLLIGSAALMAAATGAKAADPIVVPEPEPMEYVRVCDVYGAGFFYIPGTETCLKISGMVRYQMGFQSGDFGDGDGWSKYARAEVNFDARSETEYGTLGAFIKLRGHTNNDDGGPVFDPGLNDGDHYSQGIGGYFRLQQAIISLGGLSMGISDSIWDTGLSGEQDVGFFPYNRVHFLNYTFVGGNGFTASLSLEEADDSYDWTPNVVGRLGVSQGWGSADLYAAYDATAEEFAVKGIVKANLSDRMWLGVLAQYESGISYYSVDPFDDISTFSYSSTYFPGAEWSVAAELGYKFTPKLKASLGGSYYSDIGHHDSGIDGWKLGTTIDYQIVENLNSKLAVTYSSFDVPGDDFNQWSGFLRIQRDF
ncbi:porin [Nitratireductor sp. ZSWI3]|uniref:porin n=1 Tax=Nitratireductor sp. ZSWI3 TaxID=2966359 RepID=UPI0021505F2C|nr:porin [Nitratireductor sp. ZSWI3]MCR4267917.1 porin [Nitratireductor sp. ZSWI3]